MTAIPDKQQLTKYLNDYLRLFPGEAGRCEVFSGYLDRNETTGIYTRKNFDGHITTSAFIVNETLSELLLLRHKSLKRWLQPGGHVENDKSLLASALREAEEETGISPTRLRSVSVAAFDEIPFDIDSHYIPENPQKQESGHYHHDFRYLFVYDGAATTQFNPDESTGVKWVAFSDLLEDDTFGKMITKIERALLTLR